MNGDKPRRRFTDRRARMLSANAVAVGGVAALLFLLVLSYRITAPELGQHGWALTWIVLALGGVSLLSLTVAYRVEITARSARMSAPAPPAPAPPPAPMVQEPVRVAPWPTLPDGADPIAGAGWTTVPSRPVRRPERVPADTPEAQPAVQPAVQPAAQPAAQRQRVVPVLPDTTPADVEATP